MNWLEYKIFSYLFLGPRYIDRVKALMNGIADKEIHNKIKEIVELTERESYDKISTQFTSCFINDFKHVRCPPYESWYLERTVYGISAQKVLEEYLKYGINPRKQLPDHISTEMEFVSFLFYIHEKENAIRFIANHILVWAFRLVDDIFKYSKGEYTRLYGEALALFLEKEKERILAMKV